MKKARLYAMALGIGYLSFGLVYIFISGRIAAGNATTVEELRWMETLKGAGYVLVTAVLLTAAGWAFLRRIERNSDELFRQQRLLVLNERRSYAGLIAASVAHDANNLLEVVTQELRMLMRVDDEDDRARALEQLDASLDRLVSLNRHLYTAGQQAAHATRQRFELGQLVALTVDRLRTLPRLARRKITLARTTPTYVYLAPVSVETIVSNLVLNASDATRDGGRVQISVGGGERAFIEVDDDGPGVPEARRPGLFNELQTPGSDGNGLGLFSVQASVRSAGGTVNVSDSPLGGARFRVDLPLAQ